MLCTETKIIVIGDIVIKFLLRRLKNNAEEVGEERMRVASRSKYNSIV